jgi:fibronectin-binding autotransporter adhesin
MSDHSSLPHSGYISSADAALRYGCSKDYISRMCREGKLKGQLIGRNWYIEKESFRELLAKKEGIRPESIQALAEERKQTISSADAALRYGCSKDYIARMCREGKLKGHLLGRNWFIEKDSFKEFLSKKDEQKTEGAQKLAEERKREYLEAKQSRGEIVQPEEKSVSSPAVVTPAVVTPAVKPHPAFAPLRFAAVLSVASLFLVSGFLGAARMHAIAEKERAGTGAQAAALFQTSLSDLFARTGEVFGSVFGTSAQLSSNFGLVPLSTVSVQKTPAPRVVVVQPAQTAPVTSRPSQGLVTAPIAVPQIITLSGVSKDYVDTQLSILKNSLSSEIYKNSSQLMPGVSQNVVNIAQIQRIDRLSNVTATNLTVDGLSGLTDADIPDNITVNGYLSSGLGDLTIGTITGTSTSATSTFPNLSVTALSFGGDYVTSLTGSGLSIVNGALTASGSSFSTTSADYWKGVNDFFATTSASYFLSQNQEAAFSSTSVAYYLSQNSAFSTTSADYWEGQRDFFSTTSANYFADASTTLVKAYGTNVFTGTNSFGSLTTLSGFLSTASSTINSDLTVTGTASTTNLYIAGVIRGAGLSSCSGSADKLIWDSATGQFACGADAGAGGGITALGAQYSAFQTGSSQTFATSSDANIGLTITSSGNTHTFAPTWSGVLSVARGGTGLSSATANQLLIGNSSGTGFVQVATSSLGLLTTNVTEGSNLYFTNPRAVTALTGQNISIFTNDAGYTTYSNADTNAFIHASTTIPKTYTANTFGSLQTFASGFVSQASSTISLLTVGSATTSNFAITNLASTLLKTNSNGSLVPAIAGTDYQAAGNYATFSYLFPNNATTTLLSFNGGITSFASTTIGDGSAIGGLTINGGATTTGTSNLIGAIVLNNFTALQGPAASLLRIADKTAATGVILDVGIADTLKLRNRLNTADGTLFAGAATFSGNLTAAGITATSTLSVTGLSTLGGFLSTASSTVNGAFTATGATSLGSLTVSGNTALSSATSTSFAIANIASGSLLKTTTGGAIVPAVAGTDYQTFGYLFPNNATTTTLTFTNGFLSQASSTVAGTFTTTNAPVLSAFSGGLIGAGVSGTTYSIATSTNFVTSATAGTGIALSGSTGALTITNTIGYPFAATGNSTTTLVRFLGGATSTDFSANTMAIGGSATTSIASNGTLTAPNITIGSLTGLLKATSGVISTATAGTDYENPLTFSYPLVRSVNALSLAFGTTTANTWSAQNTFSSLFATNASSTNATTTNLHITGLSLGGLATDANGRVYAAATTTAGTGLTYAANAFSVNTTQNIAKLSNLTGNGFVKTSGGDGTLSIDTTAYDSFGWPFTTQTTFSTTTFSTTTPLWLKTALYASSTVGTPSIIDNLFTTNSTSTNATSTNLAVSSLFKLGSNAALSSFTGTGLAISGGSLINTIGYPFTGTNNSTSTLVSFFGGASSTALSANTLAIGGSATTSISATGALTTPTFTLTGLTSGLHAAGLTGLTYSAATSSISAGTGITFAGTPGALVGGTALTINGVGYAFAATGNSTTTLVRFLGGATSTAFSANTLAIGGTGTTSISATGALTTQSLTNLGITAGLYGASLTGTTYSAATSSISAGTGIAFSGTPGALVGGTSLTILNTIGYPFAGFNNSTTTLVNFNGNASTTRLSSTQAFFGGTATSTFTAAGFLGLGTTSPYRTLSVNGNSDLGTSALAGFFTATSTTATSIFSGSFTVSGLTSLTSATSTNFAISNIASGSILKTTTGGAIIPAVAGTDYVTGASLTSAYPFALTGNATSTLTQFNGGLTAFASSTIGNGNQNGGLTIFGGATTTGNFSLRGFLNFTDANRSLLLLQGGEQFAFSSTTLQMTSFGYQALNGGGGFGGSTAVGYHALLGEAGGIGGNAGDNSAFGAYALQALIDTGWQNTAIGRGALASLVSGNDNTMLGAFAGASLLSGDSNVGVGLRAFGSVTEATSSVAIGTYAGGGSAAAMEGNVYLGYRSGYSHDSNSNFNTLLGYQSGYSLSTGAYNIALGQNVDLPSNTASQQLNIGNVLFGTGLYNGNTVSSAPTAAGRIGIGTSSPSQALTVAGNIFSDTLWGTGPTIAQNGALNSGIEDRAILFWDANKGAFWAGEWDDRSISDADIGNASAAFGENNTATGYGSLVGGGSDNIATTSYSAIVGGVNNKVGSGSSFIGGGSVNSIFSGGSSFIGGGSGNTISGTNSHYSFIGGGLQNTVSGQNSIAFGYQGTVSGDLSALFNLDALPHSVSQSGTFAIFGNVGIGTSSPVAKLEVNGNIFGGAITATSTLTVSGLSTLGSLTVTSNTTLANATSTNFFSTVASSTNLFAQNATLGTLAAQSFSVSGATNFTGLATFANGLISQASSTIGNGNQNGGLTINGGATTTGNALFSGNVNIGTSSTVFPLAVAGGPVYFNVGNNPVALTLQRTNSVSSNTEINFKGVGVDWYMGLNATGNYAIRPNSGNINLNSVFEISSSTNNVGIGTTTPWRTLSVNGNSDLGTSALAGFFTATSSTASSFAGGLTAFASSTIGDGSAIGGLTINGGATTTGTSNLIGAIVLNNFTALQGPAASLLRIADKTAATGVILDVGIADTLKLRNRLNTADGTLFAGAATFSGNLTAAGITATSTLSVSGQTTLGSASSTALSANTLAIGGSATTSIASNGTLTAPNITIGTLTGLLKATSGVISTATAGTDYANFAWPFTTATTYSTTTFSTTTPLWLKTALYASSTVGTPSIIDNLFTTNSTSTNATSTNLAVSSLFKLGSNAALSSFTGTGLAISGGSLINTIGYPFTGTNNSTSTLVSFFGGASSTALSANTLAIGGTGTTSIASNGTLTAPNITIGTLTGLLKATSGVISTATAGTDYANFAWPFTVAANGGVSTSTLVQLLGNASTTQLSATQAFFGGTATSTFTAAGFLGVGTTSPGSALSVSGNGYFTGTVGIGSTPNAFPLTISSASANTSIFTQSSIDGTKFLSSNTGPNYVGFGAYNTSSRSRFGIGYTATNNAALTEVLSVVDTGNVGIGTTSPWGLLSVNANVLGAGAPQFVIGSSTKTDFIVTNAGQVGVGTTSPNSLLSVRGGAASTAANTGVAQFGATPAASSAGVELGTYIGGYGMIQGITFTTGTFSGLQINPFGGATYVGLTNGGTFSVGTTSAAYKANIVGTSGSGYVAVSNTNAGDIFNISSAGLVGIGTTTPGSTLSVAGNSYVSGFYNTSGTTGGYKIDGTLYLQASTSLSSIFLGQAAGNTSFTGNQNVAVGKNALTALTSGHDIVALGVNALASATSSIQDVAIGSGAMQFAITPAIGSQSNVAIGYQAFQGVSGQSFGARNVAVGERALKADTTGSFNTALGYTALSNNTTGGTNTAVGYTTMLLNTIGLSNTALGNSALSIATSSNGNVAIGSGAMDQFVGTQRGDGTFEYNTAVGERALEGAASGMTGTFNTGVGQQVISRLTTGSGNTGFGYRAGLNISSGAQNTILGYQAGQTLTTGSYNTIIGTGFNGALVDAPANSTSNFTNISNVFFGLNTSATNFTAGVGTTSPFAQFSIATPNGSNGSLSTLFAIASSTATATTTLFSINNAGLITGLNFSLANGTTTNIFATTASSTNLFAQNATLGTLAAQSFSVSGTTNFTGLATFANGFISNASSTITSGLFSMNGGASTTQITSTGSAYFATAGGNVGIGTTSPFAKLSITGNSSGNAAFSSFQISNNVSAPYFTAYDDGNIRVGYNQTAAASLTSASQGIGLIAGGANTSLKYTSALKFGFMDTDLTTTNPKFGALIAGYATEAYASDSASGMGIEFFTTPNAAGTAPIPSSRMVIDQNGNVGISTTTPAQTLSVQGNQYTSGTSFFGGAVTSTSTLTALSGIFTGTSGTTTIAAGQGFTVGSSQFVVQQGSGNIGIGSSIPASRLAISGNNTRSSWSTVGAGFSVAAATYTDTTGSGTITIRAANSLGAPVFDSTNPVTVTRAATLYIAGAPTAAGNTTITNPFAIFATGNNRFDGFSGFGLLNSGQTPPSVVTITGDQSASSWTLTGLQLSVHNDTLTDTSSTPGTTISSRVASSFQTPTFAFANGTSTITNAATLYINGAPAADASSTIITAPYAFWVNSGDARFDGNVGINLSSGQNAETWLTVAASSTVVAQGNSQISLRSLRTGIDPGELVGGIDFRSNDTNLTAPGIVVANISAVANTTHTAAALGTDLVFNTTNGTTYSEAARLTGDNKFGVGTTSPTQTLSVQGNGYFSGTSFFGGAITATSTLTVSGLSTLGSLTVTGNTTLANATSTNFFATIASSTSLFAQAGTIGTLAAQALTVSGNTTHTGILTQTGLATFTNGFVSQASSTVAGDFTNTGNHSVGGTLSVSGLSTLGGFLSTASSTVNSTLSVSGNLGVGTTSSFAKLSVKGAGTGPTTSFQVTASNDVPMFTLLDDGTFTFRGISGTATSSIGGAVNIGANFTSASYLNTVPQYVASINASGSASSDTLTLTNSGVNSPGAGINFHSGFVGVDSRMLNAGHIVSGYASVVSPASYQNNFITLGTASAATTYRDELTIKGGNVSVGTTTGYASLNVRGAGATSATRAFEASNSASTTLFIINNAGNVGIGTTTPTQTLSVQGNSYHSGTSFFGGAITATSTLTVSGATSLGVTSMTFASTTQIGSTGNAYFATGGGNVGIGTTTPENTLTVNSSAATVATFYRSSVLSSAIEFRNSWGSIFTGISSSGLFSIGPSANLASSPMLTISTTTGQFNLGVMAGVDQPGVIRIQRLDSNSRFHEIISQVSATAANNWMDFALNLGTATSSVMRLLGNGNVGIGTTSPAAKLAIKGTGTGTGLAFMLSDSNDVWKWAANDQGNFYTGTTTVGATTPLHISTVGGAEYARFCREGSSFFCTSIGNSNGSFNFTNSGTGFFAWYNGATSPLSTGGSTQAMALRGNALLVGTSTNSTLTGGHVGIWGVNGFSNYLSVTNADTGTGNIGDIFQITSAGNVGIGTTSPSQALSVNGTIYTNTGIRFPDGSIQTAAAAAGAVGTAGQVGYYAANGSTLSGTSTLFLAASGKVGIGTTSPAATFAVQSSSDIATLLIKTSSGQTSNAATWLTSSGSSIAEIAGGAAMTDNTKGVLTLWDNGVAKSSDGAILSVHADDQSPYLAKFYNQSYSTTNPVFTYFAWNDGRMVQSTETNAPLQFATNGLSNVRMTILGNGNVGIGDTNPGNLLSVSGTGSFTEGVLINSGSSFAGTDIALQIGTTSSTNIQYFRSTAGGNKIVLNNAGNNFLAIGSFSSGSVSRLGLGYTASLGSTQTEVLSVVDSGNVGIGTTSPTGLLDLSVSSGSTIQRLHNAATGYSAMDGLELSVGTGGDTYLWNYENSALQFGINNDYLMTLMGGGVAIGSTYASPLSTPPANGLAVEGNVGIGTTTPASKLQVYGAIDAVLGTYKGLPPSYGGGITVEDDSGYPSFFLIDSSGANRNWTMGQDGGSGNLSFSTFDDDGSNAVSHMYLTAAGNVGIGANVTTPGGLLSLGTPVQDHVLLLYDQGATGASYGFGIAPGTLEMFTEKNGGYHQIVLGGDSGTAVTPYFTFVTDGGTAGDAQFIGDLTTRSLHATSTLVVDGAATLAGLTVTGNTTHTGTLTQTGLATFTSGLISQASSTIGNGTNALTLNGTTTINGNSSAILQINYPGTSTPFIQFDNSVANAGIGLLFRGQPLGTNAGMIIQPLSAAVNEDIGLASKAAGAVRLRVGSTDKAVLSNSTNTFTNVVNSFVSSVNNGAATVRFSVTNSTDTALTASTEATHTYFNLGNTTRTHATGNYATQRDFRISGSSHIFATGGGTVTDVAAFSVDSPVANNLATFTNSHAIYVPSNSVVTGTGAVTNSYGLTVNAQTGATNNYAAQFMGGNVGVGTSSPLAQLSVATLPGATGSQRFLFAIASSTATATTTLFSVNNAGLVTLSSGATGVSFKNNVGTMQVRLTDDSNYASLTALNLQAANGLVFVGSSRFGEVSDGLFSFRNNAGTDSAGLVIGNATTLFPSIRHSGNSATILNGDGSLGGGLGIGTSTPWGKLSVNLNTADTNVNAFIIASSTASATTTLFVVNNQGNVGIGTTTPNAKFAIAGTGLLQSWNTTFTDSASRRNWGIATEQSVTGDWQLQVSTAAGGTPSSAVISALSSGNVGIGTTSPAYKLDVTGTDGLGVFTAAGASQRVRFVPEASRFTIETTNASQAAYSPLRLNGSTLTLAAGGTDYATLTAGGALGIGVTSVINTNDLLSVQKDQNATTSISLRNANASSAAVSVLALGNNSDSQDAQIVLTSSGNATLAGARSMNFISNIGGFGFFRGRTTATPTMVMDTSGNVGIGTTTPNAALDVTTGGIATSPGTIPTGTWAARIFNQADTATSNGLLVMNRWAGPASTAFQVGSMYSGITQPFLRIDGVGNIGIGTTTPDSAVSVLNSTAGTRMLRLSTGSKYLDFGADYANNIPTIGTPLSGSQPLGFMTNGSERMRIDASGNVGIGTTSPASLFTVVGGGACFSGSGATVACGNTAGNLYYRTANTGTYDVAERYAIADQSIAPGDIVALDPFNPMQIKKAVVGSAVLGIVSTDPGLLLGGADPSNSATTSRPVALSGRVPVTVNLEGGDIAVGDSIKLSSQTGVGTKATTTTYRVGIALEPFTAALATTSTSTIEVFIQPGLYVSESAIADLESATTTVAEALADTSTETSALAQFASSVSSGLRTALSDASAVVVKIVKTGIYATTGIFDKVFAKEVHSDKLCVADQSGETCITKSQLDALLAGAASSGGASLTNTQGGTGTSTATTTADTIGPVIEIQGENPAHVNVGATYSDLGATVTDNVDQNLGFTISLDGGPAIDISQLSVDTSVAGEHTITFSATDQAGNTGMATRTVIVDAPPQASPGEEETPTP